MYANKGDIYAARRRKRPFRMSPQARAVLFAAIIIICCSAAIAGIGSGNIERRESSDRAMRADSTLRLEAVGVPLDVPEIMVEYTGFTVSFNPLHHQPNYVAWELTAEEAAGQLPRDSKFRLDPDVPGCASDADYRRSGYDRGHMAPAADMKWSEKAMADCHFFTNICPQDHALNGGRWASLEKKCREWAARDSALTIICGPVLADRPLGLIGAAGVTVPARFFKVVMAPYADPPRAIGFVMANSTVPDGLEALAMSVDDVEAITGFDFFAELPDDIEERIESTANFRAWEFRKRKKRND